MIPKKIHYCWFGRNDLPRKAHKCIESWKKYCPDFEIVEWNEDNFDVNQNKYTRWCYENKKFAYLSDYARLLIISKEGGIYFDVDVELLRPIDQLLIHPAYFGFESEKYVNTGLGFGAEPQNSAIQQMLSEYDKLLDGEHGVAGCPVLNTQALTKCGLILNNKLQILEHAIVYPEEYFNPYDDPTGRLNLTDNTFSIHWYFKSPHGKAVVLRSKVMRPLHRLFGKDFFHKLRG